MSKFNCVLLVDDDEITNFISKGVVEACQITDSIIPACNGQQALEIISEYSEKNKAFPELIFVDVKMPVMDGFEFLEWFRLANLYKEYPTTIVALTNSTHPKDRERFKKLGVKHYLNKPLNKEKLKTFLTENSLPNVLKKPFNNTFSVPLIPANELERLKEVRKYKIVGTAPEPAFDKIVEEAAKFFNIPIALISIIEEEQGFFKANYGAPEASYVDRGMSLCSLAILQNEVTVFADAVNDPCLLGNPIVHGAFGLKFYAGAPLINSNGYNIGTLCIIDKKPRLFTKENGLKLQEFASAAMEQIEKRFKEA